MHKLEVDDIDVCVGGKVVDVTVMLGPVSGDNLEMHGLFGFVEGFSRNFPCRFCTIHKVELQKTFIENATLLHSKEMHANHVDSATAHPFILFLVLSADYP
jgi:hypothetical protein